MSAVLDDRTIAGVEMDEDEALVLALERRPRLEVDTDLRGGMAPFDGRLKARGVQSAMGRITCPRHVLPIGPGVPPRSVGTSTQRSLASRVGWNASGSPNRPCATGDGGAKLIVTNATTAVRSSVKYPDRLRLADLGSPRTVVSERSLYIF